MSPSQNITAVGLAVVASAILSFIDNFVAAISQEAGLWQFQVFRTLFAVPLLLGAAWILGKPFRIGNLPRLVWRSLIVSVGLLIYFASLGTLSVAQAAAGLFSAPLWVAILSVVLFKQRIGALGAFAVCLGFAGALMLLQPTLGNLTFLSLLPLAAGLFYGLGMMLTRHWCAGESPLVLTLGIFLTIGFSGLIMLIWVSIWPGESFVNTPWTTPTPRFFWLTLFQAVGAVIAVSLITQAYRIGNSALVAVFEYSFLIFASLWAFLLWGSKANAIAWAGIAVVVISGILMASAGRSRQENGGSEV